MAHCTFTFLPGTLRTPLLCSRPALALALIVSGMVAVSHFRRPGNRRDQDSAGEQQALGLGRRDTVDGGEDDGRE